MKFMPLALLCALCSVTALGDDCSVVPLDMPSPKPNLFSLEDDVSLGKFQLAEMATLLSRAETPEVIRLFTDEEVSTYLTGIMNKLLAHAPSYAKAFQYRFYLVLSPSAGDHYIRALPGGIIVISPHFLLRAPSDDMVGAFMGHEMAHIALRNHTRMMSLGRLHEVEQEVISRETPERSEVFAGETTMMQEEFRQHFNSFVANEGRANEFNADVWGARIAHLAGYNLKSAAEDLLASSDFDWLGRLGVNSHPPGTIRHMVFVCENIGTTEPERISPELRAVQERMKAFLVGSGQ